MQISLQRDVNTGTPGSVSGTETVDEEMAADDEELYNIPPEVKTGSKPKVLQIPRPNETRWNSNFYNMARVYRLKNALM